MYYLTGWAMYFSSVGILVYKNAPFTVGTLVCAVILFCGPDLGAVLGCGVALYYGINEGASWFSILGGLHAVAVAFNLGKIFGSSEKT